ncbi:MAG: nucleotidyltransferase family protein [Acidiferrobacterales bacterium]|nr:nucleotidyltransferase family protein [Acidiferrobacterales bacterium]
MVTRETQLLRRLCRPRFLVSELSQVKTEIEALWLQMVDQEKLIALAEQHGMAPLVYQHLLELELPLSQPIRHQFIALKLRHQTSNAARTLALKEILSFFSARQIDAILLKGAALMHALYANISLRPMSDLDILVPPAKAELAQQCLRELGYKIHENKNPYLGDHHHLPMASNTVNGVSIHVEIHTDALSRDAPGSIQFNNLTSSPIAFYIENQLAYRLGHIDTLRHLCHHTLEPVIDIKLIAVADIYGYVVQHIDKIDAEITHKKYPFVTNTIAHFHYLSPLPEIITSWIKPPVAKQPSAVGKGLVPLSERKLSNEHRIFLRLRSLIDAPDWWLHCFYMVPPGKTLLFTRYFRHPLQVFIWLLRRVIVRYWPPK